MIEVTIEVIICGIIISLCMGLTIGVLLKPTKKKIIRITEEVIEVAMKYGYIEDSRAENDYDLNVNDEGTKKIREILWRAS